MNIAATGYAGSIRKRRTDATQIAGNDKKRRRSALLALGAAAALGAVETGSSAAEKRVALSGYDPVSYFTDGRPEKGSAEYSAAFDDATYWFKSAEHRALFVADPDHYAPQFDGYCAINVSRGICSSSTSSECWSSWRGTRCRSAICTFSCSV